MLSACWTTGAWENDLPVSCARTHSYIVHTFASAIRRLPIRTEVHVESFMSRCEIHTATWKTMRKPAHDILAAGNDYHAAGGQCANRRKKKTNTRAIRAIASIDENKEKVNDYYHLRRTICHFHTNHLEFKNPSIWKCFRKRNRTQLTFCRDEKWWKLMNTPAIDRSLRN